LVSGGQDFGLGRCFRVIFISNGWKWTEIVLREGPVFERWDLDIVYLEMVVE
jgi:hypothetical protein